MLKLTDLSHIWSGLVPILNNIDKKPLWNVFLNIAISDWFGAAVIDWLAFNAESFWIWHISNDTLGAKIYNVLLFDAKFQIKNTYRDLDFKIKLLIIIWIMLQSMWAPINPLGSQ